MALEIRRLNQGTPAGIVADRRLYLAKERQTAIDAVAGQDVVEEGDPRAAFLFATPGTVIPAEDVKRLRLELVEGRVVQQPLKSEAPVAPVEAAASAPAPTETTAEVPAAAAPARRERSPRSRE